MNQRLSIANGRRFDRHDVEVLSRVDLHLQAERRGRRKLGLESVDEADRRGGALTPWRPEPWVESGAQCRHDRADRRCVGLHEVDVLGVAGGRPEMELVQRGSAAEEERRPEERVTEDLHDGTREDEVLLDLGVGGPGGVRAPLSDVSRSDHRSISTDSFTMMRHRASSLPEPLLAPGRSRVRRGRRSAIHADRGFATRFAPAVARRYPSR